MRIAVIIVLPIVKARIERPTFPIKFNPNSAKCLESIRLTDWSANEDIVVNDPQNPMAINTEYFGSRFEMHRYNHEHSQHETSNYIYN